MNYKSGFTLIECMVTLTLITLLIGVIWLNFSCFNRALIRTEVEKLYCICRYMQRHAQITHKPQHLIFDCEHHSYTYDGRTERLPPQIKFGFLPNVKGPPSDPKKKLRSAVTFEKQCITFMSHGMIQAGTVYLIDAEKTMMYALTCPIANFSFLRLYVYEKRWCLLL